MGHMGINRNVIHPRFGNFVLLDTLVIDAELDAYDTPLDYNPCADCNLCVAACPVGAISRTDDFDFFACLNHNYREFLGGFTDWADTLAAADSADEYRTKFREDETVSLWQSLGFGPQYKSAYCRSAQAAAWLMNASVSDWVSDSQHIESASSRAASATTRSAAGGRVSAWRRRCATCEAGVLLVVITACSSSRRSDSSPER
jgi:ferredoxin